MQLKVLLLPGDGIGVEVTREAVKVLREAAAAFGHGLSLDESLLGGVAIKETGDPFPEEAQRLAAEADATLMGAVGLPEFDNAPPENVRNADYSGFESTCKSTPTYDQCDPTGPYLTPLR